MKKKKSLVKELKRYNIPFEMVGDKYALWGRQSYFSRATGELIDNLYTEREVWKVISDYRNNSKPWSGSLKETSNSKERARLRENLHHELFERAEVRENKDNPWNWD